MSKKYLVMAANEQEFEFINWLNENEFQYSMLQGCYKGIKEMSFKIELRYQLDRSILIGKAKEYNQESILIIENDAASLWYLKSKVIESLGAWREVPETLARSSEAYSFDLRSQRYYMAG